MGVFISADEVTISGTKMDAATLKIHTRQVKWINKVINVQMDNVLFSIIVHEEPEGTVSSRGEEDEGLEDSMEEVRSSDEMEEEEEEADEDYVSKTASFNEEGEGSEEGRPMNNVNAKVYTKGNDLEGKDQKKDSVVEDFQTCTKEVRGVEGKDISLVTESLLPWR